MGLYIKKSDEMFVISIIKNGNKQYQGGAVKNNVYYSSSSRAINIPQNIDMIITDQINAILNLQKDMELKFEKE